MLVERAGHRLDRARGDLVALGDQVRELAHDGGAGLDGRLVALEREHVAAQEHVAVEMALERAQHGVLAAGQLGGHRVVELDRAAHYRWAAPPDH